MFKNEYQGGLSVEILGPSGKNLLGKFKSHHVNREFDKDVKSFIYILEGSTTVAKLQFPSDPKQQLGLIQRFLIVQVYVPLSKDFAVELMLTNINNSKRRVVLSSSSKDLSSTPLHAKLPLTIVKRDVWLNLCFDMRSLTNKMFSNQTFKALEEFTISGTCKVRRIFTMRSQPPDTTDIPDDFISEPRESVPLSLQFSHNVPFLTQVSLEFAIKLLPALQVITVNKVRRFVESKDAKSEVRETSGYWSSSSDDLSNVRKLSARDQTTRIAFGTKVAVETPRAATQRSGPNSARSDRPQHMRSSDHHQNGPRKVHSGKARIPSQTQTKENRELLIPGDGTKRKIVVPMQTRKPKKATLESESLPIEISQNSKQRSLISLIDEVDLSDSHDEKFNFHANGDTESGHDSSKVFEFASQPHSLPREIDPIPKNGEEIFTSRPGSHQSSREEERERIQQKILRTTPTPRVATMSPKSLRSLREVKKSKESNSMNPPSSLSPDLSLSQSGRAYDSSKYSDGEATHSQAAAPLSRSVLSLKSSDATLTESIDTLVQASFSTDPNKDNLPAPTDASMNSSGSSNQHSAHGITVSCRSVREVSGKTEAAKTLPESSEYQVGTWDESFEANMLASMKRGLEEDIQDVDDDDDRASDDVAYQANFEDSFGVSWSTYKNPPSMHPQAYDGEMKQGYPASGNTFNDSTLSHSNPRDWGNLLSPPLVLPSVIAQQKKESLSDADSITNDFDPMALSDGSSCVSYKSSTTTGDTDEEEMLDLLYDPCLNCYFDPKNGKYYELKN